MADMAPGWNNSREKRKVPIEENVLYSGSTPSFSPEIYQSFVPRSVFKCD